jgi:hypothetical protein
VDIVYKVRRRNPDGSFVFNDTVGYQIGRFAIRDRTSEDMRGINREGERIPMKKYIIDHVNTGFIVIDSDDWDEAVQLADDISRFSAKDPEAKDLDTFLKQLGPKMVEWITFTIRSKQVTDYRQYHKEGHRHGQDHV